ncbi:hypothetical protein BBJ28_00011954 [Nothophytophthora sp. Chile5]|nr:hypothetical protein BBJ28_00011954 [Nothophytophthora sp. Chile5]
MTKLLALVLAFTACLLADRASAVGVCQKSQLGSLLTNPNVTACGSDSGVVISALTEAPTDDQLTTICETDACLSLMAAILALHPDDCTLPVNENLQLMSEFVDPVVEHCAAMGIDIAGGSSVGSGSDVEVGDEDSTASDSAASSSSGSSGAASVRPSAAAAVRALVVAVAAIITLAH